MSSDGLGTIYDNAASTVAMRLRGCRGVDEVLSSIRSKVLSDVQDPLENRSLIIEPHRLSQTLGVPIATVELVTEELHILNFVHVWARAVCPVTNDDDNTIIETDCAKDFKTALTEPCGHCGQVHDELDWSSIETFFAVHVDGHRDKFNLKRFLIPRKRFAVRPSEPPPPWLERIKRFFVRRDRAPNDNRPVDQVASQLALNQPTSRAPTVAELIFKVAKLALAYCIVAPLATVLCYWLFGFWSSVIVGAFSGLAGGLIFALLAKMILSMAGPQRVLLTTGYSLSALLVGKGMFDCSFKYQSGKPIEAALSTAQSEWPVIIGAVAVFAVTTLGVVRLTSVASR